MGILKFLRIVHPLADILEKELTDALIDRYKDKDKTFTGDLKTLPKNIKLEFDYQLKQWFSTENPKVKEHWKEFKSIIVQQVTDTIKFVLKESSIDSYSKESRDILAVPKELLIKLTVKQLPDFLQKKIHFADMDNETRIALAKYAVNLKFDSILNSLYSDRTIIHIEFRDYIFVDEIKDDLYYIDKSKTATRNTMLFFSEIEDTSEEKIKRSKKNAVARWKKHLENRPDDRRFIFAKWQA